MTADADAVPVPVPAAEQGTEIVDRRSWLPLLLVYAGTLVYVTDGSLFQVLIPDIRRSFGLSLAAVGTLTSLYSLAQLAEPAVSYAGDRVRRTWLLVGEMLCLAVFTATAGLGGVLARASLVYASRAG